MPRNETLSSLRRVLGLPVETQVSPSELLPSPENVEKIGSDLWSIFNAAECTLAFTKPSKFETLKTMKTIVSQVKDSVSAAEAAVGAGSPSPATAPTSIIPPGGGPAIPIPQSSLTINDLGALIPHSGDFAAGLSAADLKANVSFLAALFGELSVEVQTLLGQYLTEFGLGSVPILKTLTSIAGMASSGYSIYKGKQEIKNIETNVASVRDIIRGQFKQDTVPNTHTLDEAFSAQFQATGLQSVIDRKLNGLIFNFGTYTLDASVGWIDPTPATGAILSGSRLAYQFRTLYMNWKMTKEVNDAIGKKMSGTEFMSILSRCPLLYCYLLRKGGEEGGYLYVEDLTVDIEASVLSAEMARVNNSDTIKKTLGKMRGKATTYINESPIKLTGPHSEKLPDVKSAWDDQSQIGRHLRTSKLCTRLVGKVYERSMPVNWLNPEED